MSSTDDELPSPCAPLRDPRPDDRRHARGAGTRVEAQRFMEEVCADDEEMASQLEVVLIDYDASPN